MSYLAQKIRFPALMLLLLLLNVTAIDWARASDSAVAARAQTDDPLWANIQATGTLRVGTAADYIPFGYYGPDNQLDGYDVALIREIGAAMGLNVELTDIAFDGLLGAVQLGQIDVAIAALAITPQRADVVDFTNVYFVGQDAVIASPRSNITINSAADLARYRIGVQRGSVYETWLRETLVAPGAMAAGNLFVYATTPPSVRDLLRGAVDLLILDAAAAESYVARGSVKLVAEGLNKQRFAMAIPKGANMLREALNSTLSELQAEGRVAALAQSYLLGYTANVQPDPTTAPPAPAPSASPTPATCIDGSTYLATGNTSDPSVIVPTVLQPGQFFQKEVRMRNSGSCVWDGAYQLAYIGGNVPAAQMNGAAVPVQGMVAPNQEYPFYLNLTAPAATGLYQATWELRNGQGTSFGERVLISVHVPDPPPPVPTPTPNSQPNIQFSVDRTYIQPGECINFSWRVENVRAVFFYALGEEQAGVGGIDQRARCPTMTTTFELRVIERDNAQVIRQITVNVSGGQLPQIQHFELQPATQLSFGECATLNWNVTGQVNYVRIRRNGQVIWDGAPLTGSLRDCPSAPGTVDYVVEAQGPAGSSATHRYLNVLGT